MELNDLKTSRDEILDLYRKTEKSLQTDVDILREWMKKQPHLPADLLQDEYLEIQLLKNKFSVEKVKRKIESYCTLKGVQRFEYLLDDDICVPSEEPQFHILIPKLTDDFHRILIGKVCDPEKWDLRREFANGVKLREIMSRFDYNDGEIILFDLSACSPMIISKLRVNLLNDIIELTLKAYSARVKEIHIISKLAFTIFNWAKPLLPSKIASRVKVHDNIEDIGKLLPRKCLPKDYGGELKSMDEFRSDWDRIYANHRSNLLQYLDTKAREEFRQGGLDTDIMQGTFKKLEID